LYAKLGPEIFQILSSFADCDTNFVRWNKKFFGDSAPLILVILLSSVIALSVIVAALVTIVVSALSIFPWFRLFVASWVCFSLDNLSINGIVNVLKLKPVFYFLRLLLVR